MSAGRGPARHEPLVVGDHAGDLGRLEHRLGDQHRPAVARAPPGKVSTLPREPSDETLDDRVRVYGARAARHGGSLSRRRDGRAPHHAPNGVARAGLPAHDRGSVGGLAAVAVDRERAEGRRGAHRARGVPQRVGPPAPRERRARARPASPPPRPGRRGSRRPRAGRTATPRARRPTARDPRSRRRRAPSASRAAATPITTRAQRRPASRAARASARSSSIRPPPATHRAPAARPACTAPAGRSGSRSSSATGGAPAARSASAAPAATSAPKPPGARTSATGPSPASTSGRPRQ